MYFSIHTYVPMNICRFRNILVWECLYVMLYAIIDNKLSYIMQVASR